MRGGGRFGKYLERRNDTRPSTPPTAAKRPLYWIIEPEILRVGALRSHDRKFTGLAEDWGIDLACMNQAADLAVDRRHGGTL